MKNVLRDTEIEAWKVDQFRAPSFPTKKGFGSMYITLTEHISLRVSPRIHEIARKEINNMRDAEIITQTPSDWSFPILIMTKMAFMPFYCV